MNENNDFNREENKNEGNPNGYYSYNYTAGPNYNAAPEYTPKPKKVKKGLTVGKVIALCLVCSLLGGMMGFGGALLYGRMDGGKVIAGAENVSETFSGRRDTSVIDVNSVDTSAAMTPAQVYAANVNSTVGIVTSVVTTNFWGYQTTSPAAGSGFIYSDDGYIITNYHVVEGASSITVSTYSGDEYAAEVVGYDESNDVAVLKIDAKDLTPVIIGDSDNMNVGDSVVAIGNPLGELTFSLTAGAVSALDREITLSSGSTMELIQTDCAINSGNSGGALFNLYGEVVGITNAKYSSSSMSSASIDNIGFAIPINNVIDIVKSIVEKGYVSKPYIGVSVTSVSSEMRTYGIPAGAVVKVVAENGPAAKGGIQENDIITKANGTDIADSDALIAFIGKCSVGDTVTFTVYRQGTTVEVKVTIEEKIVTAESQQTEQQTQSEQQQSQQSQGYSQYGYQDPSQGQQGQQGFSFPFGFGF